MPIIERLTAAEILDSRGRPTVSATCTLAGGAYASASVPSGASTGTAEALELRDRDSQRYGGLGCRKAVALVNGQIQHALAGPGFADQAELDRALIELDGTPDKSRLGANATLAVSVAFARACAQERGVALYQYFAGMLGHAPDTLPRLTINLFSGGMHAGRQVAIQDVLIVPARPTTVDDSLAMAYDVYQAAAALVLKRYGMRLLTADEGGLAPQCDSTEELIETAVVAIKSAGYKPGIDVMLALDVAASHFYASRQYHLDGATLDSAGMIARLVRWVERYPIVSVEDGLAEDDWEWWPTLRHALEKRALVVGDDLLCTNPQRIRRAVEAQACNALLLKPNQIGTLTEAAEAWRLAKDAGWQVTISVRSGETEDNWAADLAVGWRGDQFKPGSIRQVPSGLPAHCAAHHGDAESLPRWLGAKDTEPGIILDCEPSEGCIRNFGLPDQVQDRFHIGGPVVRARIAERLVLRVLVASSENADDHLLACDAIRISHIRSRLALDARRRIPVIHNDVAIHYIDNELVHGRRNRTLRNRNRAVPIGHVHRQLQTKRLRRRLQLSHQADVIQGNGILFHLPLLQTVRFHVEMHRNRFSGSHLAKQLRSVN